MARLFQEAETAISRDGRNIMFELALGAEWALCGADVELLEPDLLVKMPDRRSLLRASGRNPTTVSELQ